MSKGAQRRRRVKKRQAPPPDAADMVNDWVRSRMREDGMYRRFMPPLLPDVTVTTCPGTSEYAKRLKR